LGLGLLSHEALFLLAEFGGEVARLVRVNRHGPPERLFVCSMIFKNLDCS
jgi:hypothetical protein